jgi:hypothetical protein
MRGSAFTVTLLAVLVILPTMGCIESTKTTPGDPFPPFDLTQTRIERMDDGLWRVSTEVLEVHLDDLRWSSQGFRISRSDIVKIEVNGTPPFDGTGTQQGWYAKGPGTLEDIVEVGDTLVLTGLDDGIMNDYISMWIPWFGEYGFLDEIGTILLDVRMESLEVNASGGIDASFRIEEFIPDVYTIYFSDLDITMEYANGTPVLPAPRVWRTMDGAPTSVYTFYLKERGGSAVVEGDRVVLANAPAELEGGWVHFQFDDKPVGSVQIGGSS